MTLPYEEKIAVNNAHLLLSRLLFPQLTPGVPKAIRDEASRCLRHYPAPYQVDRIFKHYFESDDITCPSYFLDKYRDVADEYRSLEVELIWNELDKKSLEARRRRAYGKVTKKKVAKLVKDYRRRQKNGQKARRKAR